MKKYKNIISLSKNERGIWDLDTIKGCKSGLDYTKNGCYGDCYAYKTAKRYGIDFSKSIERNFIDKYHLKSIVNKIKKIDMPFIRIGCSGDPSENWEHTINVIEKLRFDNQYHLFENNQKQIVIITRHWNLLTDFQLLKLKKFNIVINTSISALDDNILLNKCLNEYKRLKPYCKSILRVVTADFNVNNEIGSNLYKIQNDLLNNENVIDTVFRPSKNNKFVIDGIINTQKMKFINSVQLLSKYNKKTYIGKCDKCKEMCGLNNF